MCLCCVTHYFIVKYVCNDNLWKSYCNGREKDSKELTQFPVREKPEDYHIILFP